MNLEKPVVQRVASVESFVKIIARLAYRICRLRFCHERKILESDEKNILNFFLYSLRFVCDFHSPALVAILARDMRAGYRLCIDTCAYKPAAEIEDISANRDR